MVKRRSSKLESLPDDLKDIANKIVEDKFGKEKNTATKAVYDHTFTHGPTTLRFAPTFDDLYLASPVEVSNVDITYNREPRENSIDQYALDNLRRFTNVPIGVDAKLVFSFKPVGTFRSNDLETYELHRRVKSLTHDLTISCPIPIDTLQEHLMAYMQSLTALYGGYFVAILSNWETRANKIGTWINFNEDILR